MDQIANGVAAQSFHDVRAVSLHGFYTYVQVRGNFLAGFAFRQ